MQFELFQGYVPRIHTTELGLGCRYHEMSKNGLEVFRDEISRHQLANSASGSKVLVRWVEFWINLWIELWICFFVSCFSWIVLFEWYFNEGLSLNFLILTQRKSINPFLPQCRHVQTLFLWKTMLWFLFLFAEQTKMAVKVSPSLLPAPLVSADVSMATRGWSRSIPDTSLVSFSNCSNFLPSFCASVHRKGKNSHIRHAMP